MDKKSKQDEFSMIPTKEFLNDPFAFGALMDFQYGTSEESQDGSEFIARQLKGVNCTPDDLDWVVPNLEFLAQLGGRNDTTSRLYHNDAAPSRIAITCLRDAGFDLAACELRYTPKHQLPTGLHCYEPVPTLVLPGGAYAAGAPKIVEFARDTAIGKLLKKEQARDPRAYRAWERRRKHHNRPGNNSTHWYDFSKKVACFDAESRHVYTGPADKAPYPVAEGLGEHGRSSWGSISCWHLGNLEDLLRKENAVTVPMARGYLFPFEIGKLQKEGRLTTYLGSGMLSALGIIHQELRHYFASKGELYKVEASYVD